MPGEEDSKEVCGHTCALHQHLGIRSLCVCVCVHVHVRMHVRACACMSVCVCTYPKDVCTGASNSECVPILFKQMANRLIVHAQRMFGGGTESHKQWKEVFHYQQHEWWL